MDRLKGKVAIVTGAAKGLGEADARLFAKEGAAHVIVADVDVANGERVARDIGPQATFMRLDVRHEAEWKDLIAAVVKKHGRLDVLVNNAGVVELHTPETITEDKYRFIMSVMIDGTVFGCKHAIAAMKASGGGSIINMSSVASIIGEPMVAAYCAAKGAIESYTRCVAVHCAQNRYHIRCNSVHPSTMETPMVLTLPEKIATEHLEAMFEGKAALAMPVGSPYEVAYMVLYLASDESRFVNGAKMVIDASSTITQGAVPADA
jgi:3(or 17)beta-hydroxysteroid dehydrogenase